MIDRRPLREAAIISPRKAAEWLPMRNADALAWLRASGLICRICGCEMVIWGDVIKAVRGEGAPEPTTPSLSAAWSPSAAAVDLGDPL